MTQVSVSGKIGVVTGAGWGIGRSHALQLAAGGGTALVEPTLKNFGRIDAIVFNAGICHEKPNRGILHPNGMAN